MGTIHQTYYIKAKPDKIFKYIENIWNIQYHLKLTGIKLNFEVLSKRETGIGAAYHWYGEFLDRKVNTILFVVKIINNKLIIYQTYTEFLLNIILHLETFNLETKIDFTLNYLKPSGWFYQSSPNSLINNSFLKKIIDPIFKSIKSFLEQENYNVIK